jgi:subtilisin-like proprotein convertase family protein
MLTHMFYLSNWYHDRLFTYGFTPAARNFQQDNFGAGGLGGDRLLLEGQDSSGESNANYSGGDDGIPGRVQMFRYTGPVIDRDSGLDSEILIHELTHGLSNRLVGNGAGLNWEIGGGLGEGWSDFYGLSLLNNSQTDDPNGNYSYGGYTSYKANGNLTDNYLYGSRRFPYSTNNTVNPLTWADIDDVTNDLSGGIAPSPLNYNANGGMEAHNAGEIWALTLWEVRSRIIADPAGANGNVALGNNTTLSVVTDAMRLFTPGEPSYVDARNALIDADCAANSACPNEASIWGGFADRGLGYNAIAPLSRQLHFVVSRMGVGESFETPNLDVNNVSIDDSVGGNSSGAIDPGETVKLSVNLKNPWRGASRGVASATATLTTSTAGVSIVDGASNYPAIAAQGTSAPNSGDSFSIQLSPSIGCGAAVRLTLSINSTMGIATRQIVLRVGASSGTGSPVVYTRNPSPDIVIPDQSARGVGDSLTITDDLEIADLNFRVDSVTHASVGQLSIMLKAPNGYGTDLVSLMGCGINIEVCNTGDNITNMVIDQTAAVPNDQLITPDTSAPFTDDFLPVFNSPAWNTPPYGGPDPVGQLSRLNGLSTQGTWSVRAADWISPNTGTLNQWSLIVTPRTFACTTFNPGAPVTVGGRVIESNGHGIKGVFVSLSVEGGPLFTTFSNSFGYFRFPSVPVGATYVLNASNKRYLFDSQQVVVSAGISDLLIQGTRPPQTWGN